MRWGKRGGRPRQQPKRTDPKHSWLPTSISVSVHTFLSIFRLRTLETPAPRPRCSPADRRPETWSSGGPLLYRSSHLPPPHPRAHGGRQGEALGRTPGLGLRFPHSSILLWMKTLGPASACKTLPDLAYFCSSDVTRVQDSNRPGLKSRLTCQGTLKKPFPLSVPQSPHGM